MNFSCIYHRNDENFCYPVDEDNLMIMIRTGYDIDRIVLYCEDPFRSGIAGGNEHWEGIPHEMTDVVELKYNKLWRIIVKPEFKRCQYYFELHSGDEVMCMMEDDFYSREYIDNAKAGTQYFIFPWMNSSDIVNPPAWVKDTVWYQIFPERFCNGNPLRNKPECKTWKYEPIGKHSFMDWYGGDLEGIYSKLEYLHELGITGIYLNPIFLADSNHKYETKDYEIIDPGFGDDEIMKKLVEKAHTLGIRIMLDAVFNHCGFRNKYWIDVLEKGPESKYYKWFCINKWPFDKTDYHTFDGKFYSFAFTSSMPKLNTNNKEVVDYLTNISKGWIEKYDIDGIRFDVGNEIAHSFLKHLNKELKAIKPDLYLMGEIWHDSEPWLKGDEYDAVMNYPFVNSVKRFWNDDSFGAKDFEYALNRCFNMYRIKQAEVTFNMFDSHDTDRIMNRVNGNFDSVIQQMVVLFTMAGSPCIYYGTEVGMEGGFDPDCRRCMPWDEINAGLYNDRLKLMKSIISLRHKYDAFKNVDTKFIYDFNNNKVLHYVKTNMIGQKFHVILNCSCDDILVNHITTVIFSNKVDNGLLRKDGVLVYEETNEGTIKETS